MKIDAKTIAAKWHNTEQRLTDREIQWLVDELAAATTRVAELEQRQAELLATIAQLSKDSSDPAEADELRGQIAALIAEVVRR